MLTMYALCAGRAELAHHAWHSASSAAGGMCSYSCDACNGAVVPSHLPTSPQRKQLPISGLSLQDAMALATALRACGLTSARFSPGPGRSSAAASQPPPPPPPPPAAGQQQPAGPQLAVESGCLRDSTNQPNRSPSAAPSLGAAGSLPQWMAACAVPLGQLAALGAAAGAPAGGRPPPPPPPPPARPAHHTTPAVGSAPRSLSQLADFAAQLAPGAGAGPLSISGYTALAQRLAGAAAAGSGARPYGHYAPAPPPPQALPLPLLVAPAAVQPSSGSASAYSQWHSYLQVPPPPPPLPPPAAGAACSFGDSTDPLRLQAILTALQLVQLHQRAGSPLQASAGQQ